jgi:hypothetical protein
VTTEINNSRVTSIVEQSSLVLESTVELADVELMFDEIRAHKCFFEDWYGRQSFEYKLANTLLNVIRLIVRSKNDKIGYPKMTIKEWSRVMPIRLEWIKQLQVLIDSRQVA